MTLKLELRLLAEREQEAMGKKVQAGPKLAPNALSIAQAPWSKWWWFWG